METFLLGVLIIMVAALAVALVMVALRLRDLKGNGGVELIKSDVTELNRTIMQL